MTAKLSVLFVDDDVALLDAWQLALRDYRKDWASEFLSCPLKASELLDARQFDVVVANQFMPEMDGIRFLSVVEQRQPQSVRIMISDTPNFEGIIHAIGPSHQFITKPFSPEELIDLLERTYNLHKALADPVLRREIAKLRSLPTPPDVFMRLTQEIQKGDPSARSIAGMMSEDVALTAEILRVTNSGYFGLETKVYDVFQAIRLLGMETVHALICAAGVFRQFDFEPDMAAFLDDLDVHCLLVATQARHVAHKLELREGLKDQAFCAGMLSCVGTLVLMNVYPEKMRTLFSRVLLGENYTDVERELFGASQGEIGAYLLGLWGFSDIVVEAVLYHDHPSACSYQDHSALTCVHLARALGAELEINGTAVHPIALDEDYVRALNLPPELSSIGLE